MLQSVDVGSRNGAPSACAAHPAETARQILPLLTGRACAIRCASL